MNKLEQLQQLLTAKLANFYSDLSCSWGELTLQVTPENLIHLMTNLKTEPEFLFEQCQDLCGVDYLTYGEKDLAANDLRFCAVYHLLSITHNWRLRVKCFALNNELPIIPSVNEIWNSVNWFEREAFDLFGIVFSQHPDLRRILTDYGFIGHPFRKDFPLSGYMEMRYDETQKRVIYQPVTIEPREIQPRVIREDDYGYRD